MPTSSSSSATTLSPADAMHLDVVREHPALVPRAETILRHLFLATSGTAPVSRAVRTSEQSPTAVVPLHELFPVLKGARAMAAGAQLPPHVQMLRTLETAHHGTVILTVVGCGGMLAEATPAHFELVTSTPAHFELVADGEIQLRVHSRPPMKKPTGASKNKLRKQAAPQTVAIVSLSGGLGCAQCGRFGGMESELDRFDGDSEGDEEEIVAPDDQQRPNFLRCTRCWDKLRFPIWYCCRGCQAAHYPQHRRLCGKMLQDAKQ